MDEGEILDPERYRTYLTLMARSGIASWQQHRVSPSDIVNQTLFEAHQKLNQFRGKTGGELAAWLTQALQNNLRDAIRRLHAAKRDVCRDVSLDERVGKSARRLEELAGTETTPSDVVIRAEQLVRVSDAICRLPEDQRIVLEQIYLSSLPAKQVARQLVRTEGAVAGLLHRALVRLRREMKE